MKPYLVMWQLARVVAVVAMALVVALALIHSRRDHETPVLTSVLTFLALGKADVPAHELARCRSVAPGDTEVFEACRRIWAENRRHFFASSKSSQQTIGIAPHAVTLSGNRVDDVAPIGAERVGGR